MHGSCITVVTLTSQYLALVKWVFQLQSKEIIYSLVPKDDGEEEEDHSHSHGKPPDPHDKGNDHGGGGGPNPPGPLDSGPGGGGLQGEPHNKRAFST